MTQPADDPRRPTPPYGPPPASGPPPPGGVWGPPGYGPPSYGPPGAPPPYGPPPGSPPYPPGAPPPYPPGGSSPYPPGGSPPYPPYGPPPSPAPGRPPARRSRGKWIAFAALGLVVLVGAAVAVWLGLRGGGDEARIRQVVGRFATAVAADDQSAILAELCPEEATAITDDEDYVPDDPGSTPSSTAPAPTISQVRIHGDVAAATVDRSGAPPATTLYLRRQDEGWKVCAAAQQQFDAADR